MLWKNPLGLSQSRGEGVRRPQAGGGRDTSPDRLWVGLCPRNHSEEEPEQWAGQER